MLIVKTPENYFLYFSHNIAWKKHEIKKFTATNSNSRWETTRKRTFYDTHKKTFNIDFLITHPISTIFDFVCEWKMTQKLFQWSITLCFSFISFHLYECFFCFSHVWPFKRFSFCGPIIFYWMNLTRNFCCCCWLFLWKTLKV